jgi:peptidoglycan/LPS O-acetylase OafA/YrhL
MKYRADIDGLRAVAVAFVVLFHARLEFIGGGYVGVDVFFVISGFLISSILREDISNGRFSLSQFYERRVRRIFPAAFVVLLCTAAASYFILMPKEFKEFGASLISCLGYFSNFYFWRHTGYFDNAGELNPLLHTWSLAVEEQFYLVVPLLLYFLIKKSRDPQRWILLLFAISLVLNVVLVRISPSGTFFSPFTRAWELFAGTILAFTTRPYFRTAVFSQLAGILGALLIAVPAFLYTAETRFPGEAAILPVLGTFLVIASGADHRTWTASLLSNRFLVAIGKISFSLYLWHWPVFVLIRYVKLGELDNFSKIVGLALTVGLSVLSYLWIEKPFRRAGGIWGTPFRAFSGFAACTTLLLIASAVFYVTGGLPSRFSPQTQAFAMGAFDVNPRRAECDSRSPDSVLADQVCRIGVKDGAATFAVLGDSFGDALLPGIASAAQAVDRKGLVLTAAGCYPLLGIAMPDNSKCRPYMDAAIERIRRDQSIETVFIIGRWTTAILGMRFGYGEAPTWLIRDDQTAAVGVAENEAVVRRSLARTVEALAPKKIVIVAYIPEQKVYVPQAAALSELFDRKEPIGVSREVFDARQRKVHELLDAGQGKGLFSVIDVGAKLCNDERCSATDQGIALYSDDNHLSASGANHISNLFSKALDPGFQQSSGETLKKSSR